MSSKLKFSELTDTLPYGKCKFRTELQKLHSDIIQYAMSHMENNRKSKKGIIDIMNNVSYAVKNNEHCVIDYDKDNPFINISMHSDNDLIASLGNLYIDFLDIDWDFDMQPVVRKTSKPNPKLTKQKQEAVVDTPKEDLYLRAPQYPRFDTSSYWLSDTIGSEHFYIYPSLPIVPEKQGDISCTTDVNKMTEKELLKLYPNHVIHTRSPIMYEPVDGVVMDKDLGLLIPIEGYTLEQLRDNIIRYPHFFQLTRILNDKEISFYKHIEIDGQLYDTLEVWDSLPISKKLPKTSEFIKEYIVRKYLLDRDAGMEHKYPLHGTLDPFLTIFAPMEFYSAYGNPAELMRKCVLSRVEFFKSRNPYLIRYSQVKQGLIPAHKTIDCPFKQYCRKSICKYVCADYAEFQYLIERNSLDINKEIFSYSDKSLQQCSEWLTAASGTSKVVISDKSSEVASRLIYAAICQQWKGNAFHCGVFNLDFADYLQKEKGSWNSTTSDEDLEYLKIFIASAKTLIISNLDFVTFNDFSSQTLHNLVYSRKNDKTTIIVSPKLNSLVGNGSFFPMLKAELSKKVINE